MVHYDGAYIAEAEVPPGLPGSGDTIAVDDGNAYVRASPYSVDKRLACSVGTYSGVGMVADGEGGNVVAS